MSNTRFTVRRLGWHQAPHGDNYTRRLPTAEAVAHFDNFDAAEYHRRSREHEARAGENPFRFGGAALFYQSSLDAMRLHDWLLDEGVDPPAEQLRHRDWKHWWDAFSHTWNETQLAHAWNAFDKVRFFDVFEETAECAFWLVTHHDRPHGLFAVESRAAAACARLNNGPALEPHEWGWYRYHGLLRPQNDAEADHRPTRGYQVVPVPGGAGRDAGVGFVVLRRAFSREGRTGLDHQGRDSGSRVPVRVFADRATAHAHRDELTAAARELMNPFRLFEPEESGLVADAFLEAIDQLLPPLPRPTYFSSREWREWWDLCQEEATPAQRDAAWELFSDHPLFEVLPMDVQHG